MRTARPDVPSRPVAGSLGGHRQGVRRTRFEGAGRRETTSIPGQDAGLLREPKKYLARQNICYFMID